jgi:effector-binding domain-containing protein/uncharacterized protein YndB with AHSA1/START domain
MPKITVRKTIRIAAPPESVFAAIIDYRRWTAWSPWLIAEPGCTVTYDADGKGYSWEGKIIGSGRMETTAQQPNRSVDSDLTFLKPWKSHAKVRFELVPHADGSTEVVWSMDSSLPFFMFFLKSMMEGFIGMDYDRGLKMMKDHVETGHVPSKLEFTGVEDFSGFSFIGVKTQCAIPEIGPQMEKDLTKLANWLKVAGAAPAGPPFAQYHLWSPMKNTVQYTIGFPMAAPTAATGDFISGSIPACKVYVVRHTGPYRHLGNAWASGMMHGRAKAFRQARTPHSFEIYENDPATTPEDQLRTKVCLICKS